MNSLLRLTTLLFVLGPMATFAQETADSVAPEENTSLGGAASGVLAAPQAAKDAGKPVVSDDWMVVAAHPLAVRAGGRILATGGTAADAMVAVQAVLGLVEPQSSGLGGGAFLVWFDGETGELTTLDGREKAPLSASPRMLQGADGEPLKFFEAVVGGLSVGVPGTPLLMEEAHVRWGSAQWPSLFADAISLAEDGFTVTPRMASSVARDAERLASHPDTASYFLPDGVPLEAGQLLRNPAYSDTLRLLAAEGSSPFYSGEVSDAIVRAVRSASNPGMLTPVDMALYSVEERPAVCAPYRGNQICGMGPPSSGALAVGQILGQLEGYDLSALGPDSPEAWRLIGDSSRLAFADRGKYVADSDYVPVPVQGMVDAAYMGERGKLLSGETALPEVRAGTPEFEHTLIWANDEDRAAPSTSHITIADIYGNVLSMTTTIENGFGSRVMVRGFLLNNELTDFSFRSHRNGVPVANAVAPGKRPRSSMAPTIVLRNGKPILALGSPGGSRIIPYVAKTIIAHLDWGLDVQQAVSLPHLVNRFGTYDLENEALQVPLQELGYEVKVRGLNSGLHAISFGDKLMGGADPRREGLALGD